LHGSGDRLIPCAQSERFRDALTTAGVPVQLHIYDGADHIWLGAPQVAAAALERTIAFLSGELRD
jgi:acetyl esterase/lipase